MHVRLVGMVQENLSWILVFVVFLYGLLFGSFANVVAWRLPRHESIVYPGSHCPNCLHRLSPLELIPVLSWFLLRGHCKACKAPISEQYPAIELSVGILWVLTLWHTDSWIHFAVWALFWFFLLVVVGTDLTYMKVPNRLSLPAAALFLVVSIITGIQPWQSAIAGMLTGFFLVYGIHLLSKGRMGLGDVKLYLGIGSLFGPALTIESFLLACAFGTIVGSLLLVTRLVKKGQPIPFVPYIATGVILTAFYGQPLLHWYVATVIH